MKNECKNPTCLCRTRSEQLAEAIGFSSGVAVEAAMRNDLRLSLHRQHLAGQEYIAGILTEALAKSSDPDVRNLVSGKARLSMGMSDGTEQMAVPVVLS